MRWGVVTFPGSLDDRDTVRVLRARGGSDSDVVPLWHKSRDLQDVDCVILPGGFSYGDYLRPGAMARFAPILESVIGFAQEGGLVLGICNGFQILCEAGLLPGALVRNRSLSFICEMVPVRVETTDMPFTSTCSKGQILTLPIKHGAGCFVADTATLDRLENGGQVVLRYVDRNGDATDDANPNGSQRNIAGVMNESGNVFGLMPHPEHACARLLGGEDGWRILASAAETVRATERRAPRAVPRPG